MKQIEGHVDELVRAGSPRGTLGRIVDVRRGLVVVEWLEGERKGCRTEYFWSAATFALVPAVTNAAGES